MSACKKVAQRLSSAFGESKQRTSSNVSTKIKNEEEEQVNHVRLKEGASTSQTPTWLASFSTPSTCATQISKYLWKRDKTYGSI